MAARFVSTSRLGNIIQMITLSRQTGILRAMRTQGPGAQRELGQIRFVQGEPVTALLGETTGGAALNALANWGECDYAFDTTADQDADSDPALGAAGMTGGYPSSPALAPTPTPNSSPSVSSSWPSSYSYLNAAPGPQTQAQSLAPGAQRPRVQSFPPLPQGPVSGASYAPDDYAPDSGSLPGYQGPGGPGTTSYPRAADRSRGGQGYAQPLANLPSLPNLNYPGYPTDPGASPAPPYPTQRGGPPSPPRTPSPPPSAPSYAPASTYNLQPETLAVIPYRTPMARSVEQLPLDRRERMVLLLIDGQRSISDLIRLTRRSEQELYAVLNHLRLLGLLAM